MSVAPAQSCVPATFNSLSLFGAEVTSLEASLVANYNASVHLAYRFTQPSIQVQNATFCNVTVSYTHPGTDDNVNVEAWLPVGNWNGRFQAVGGGGWVAGRSSFVYTSMAGAIGDGYATITTDAGLGSTMEPSTWALLSPGNVNLHLLQDLGSTSLNDEVSASGYHVHSILSGYDEMLIQYTGDNRERPHQKLLRRRSQLLVLEWLLPRRSPGPHACPALSYGI